MPSSLLRLLFTYIGVACFVSALHGTNGTTAPLQMNTTTHSFSFPQLLPVLFGYRMDANSTTFTAHGRIVIPPDKTRLTVYGLDLDRIIQIDIVYGTSCDRSNRTVYAYTNKDKHFTASTSQHKIEIFPLAMLEEGEFSVCAYDKDRALATFNESVPFFVEVPRPERIYKFGWFWLTIVLLVLLHVASALFSGLTLGLMTLTVRELEIIAACGSEQEQKYANAVLPLRRRGNQLLCTLLLGNTLCNATISIAVDDLIPGEYSIIAATLTMLLLGEILPQSICVNNALATGARMLFFARFCMYVFAIFAWPISKVLDCFVGEEHESYDRKRMMELMKHMIHNNPEADGELKIAQGAMNLKDRFITEAMTGIEDVFMLPETANLNSSAIAAIVRAGYTRIPVFRKGNKKDICDVLITKDLALIDPDDNYTVRMLCNIYKHRIPRMGNKTTLFNALQIFRKGDDGHLAVVYQLDETNVIGIITLEDVVEEILQEEIKDEFDLKREKRGHEKILWDTTAPPAVMGKQLQTVTYQFCVANEEAFKEHFIEKNIFQRLMTSCTKSVDVHYLKPLGGALTVPIKQLPRCARLYTKDEMSDRYILILEGRAEVTIGQGGMKFEAGPFHRFGQELLQQLMKHADELCKRPSEKVVDSKQLMQFKPDFSVAVFEDCTFLEVTADMYIKALRMTRLQRETKNTTPVFPDFKTRGTAVSLKPPSPSRKPLIGSKEQMSSTSREEVMGGAAAATPGTPSGPTEPETPALNTAVSLSSPAKSQESNRTTEERGKDGGK
ncbi:hypothetical protein PENTCL1PPCAC_3907 [Pristionchus entomophagus]|uniref:Metal transporter CNNM2 n=1 Tax=Pristionchus entomophagus TaxID=358040 RepID=A0AAV5SED0_9BILA|nr:hypothetical protein PENTCL1PPCAC_3907 [Pristionchus entomophagus]